MKRLLKNLKKVSYDELLVFILICILIVYFLITLFDKNTHENFYNSSANSGITNVSTTSTNGSRHLNNNSDISNINKKTLVIDEGFLENNGEGPTEDTITSTSEDTITSTSEDTITSTYEDTIKKATQNIEDNKDLIQTTYILLNKLIGARDLAEASYTKSATRLLHEKRTNPDMTSNYLRSLEVDKSNNSNILKFAKEKLLRQQNYIANLKVSGKFDSEFAYLKKSGLIDIDDDVDTNNSNNIGPTTSTLKDRNSKDKQTIIHNNYNQYYGGNKELTQFLKKLVDDKKNHSDMTLMDQGMCSDLNNKLDTMSLAEFKNNRFIQDLKQKCDTNEEECPLWAASTDQTSLIGTLLEKAKNTNVGSMIPKKEISTDYL